MPTTLTLPSSSKPSESTIPFSPRHRKFFSHWVVEFETMQAKEVPGLNYLLPSNPSPHPLHYSEIQNNINVSEFQVQRFCNQFISGFKNPAQVQDFNSPQSSCISSNSTSDEADEQQQQQQSLSIINERKQRRMISNRESARRSRMRKQRHLDELWSQVIWLRSENHQLIDKLNHVSECHDQVLQENVQLKEETSKLRQMVSDMQLHSPFSSLSPLEEVPRSSAYLRSDSSSQSLQSSMDLLG